MEDGVTNPHDVLVLNGEVALAADLDHVGHDDDLEDDDGEEILENVLNLAITARGFEIYNTQNVFIFGGDIFTLSRLRFALSSNHYSETL